MTAIEIHQTRSASADSIDQLCPVLEMIDVSKRFGATQALDGVSLALLSGARFTRSWGKTERVNRP